MGFYLPVLVLWLKGYQRTLFTARENVLWGGAVNLLQLTALFLPLPTICSQNTNLISTASCRHRARSDKGAVFSNIRGCCSNLKVPPRSPSVKILRKERELQSTPL